MKKTLFTAVLILGIISLKAQEIHFGVRLGGSFTKLKAIALDSDAKDYVFDFNKQTSMKPNIELGAFAEVTLTDQIAVQPEFNFAGAGVTSKESYNNYDLTSTVSLTYIQAPLLFKYYLNDNISINAGPQLGLLMSAKEKTKLTGEDVDESDTDDVKKDYKSTDFGFNLGGSYKMENGLFFDFRYYMGLSGVLKDNENWADFKNNGLKFSIGYYFN